jgi:hypothetical protein
MSATLAVEFAAFAGAGLALGFAHFAALRVNVWLYTTPGAIWRPIALNLARLALTGGVLGVAAIFGGALPALAALIGFVLARAMVLRTAWSRP